MRAAFVDRYGPPERITITETPPPEPRKGEALVRVEAAAVTAGDARMRAGRFPKGFGALARLGIGLRGPRARTLGGTLSGRVEKVAPDVTRLAPGDQVAGMTGARMGSHAEYVAVPAAALVYKPTEVSHADAAAVLFGGTTALHFLRDRAEVAPGDTVLVNGASGAVGTSAVQLARHFGAKVTAVTSARNRSLVADLGAGRVIDYAETPVARLEERFDIVFDAVGNITRAEGLRLLNPSGSLILAVAGLLDTVLARGPVLAGPAPERAEDFAFLLELAASGDLDPVAEVVGGLEALREAHRRIDTGRKVGNLVIAPGMDGTP
ncbi:NAD(P)-dependent alcohol dehydrogenase [Glycomyces salinus]|uniref:NAD(P)-dependent alcohol dehydrogenase n=1 Tax=Glycomyces salinus TaxID=980294 RepID=UPI0018ED5515|nr:NAD(P)-dependent alcohol dehydrogenase [Glycomyces salinus]